MTHEPEQQPSTQESRQETPENTRANWLERLQDLLRRAEKKVSDNFRVPPNGG